ncbi:MAG: choice-of-anchor J domain-containing protein [Candidatus Bathyarchaeia archaeon]
MGKISSTMSLLLFILVFSTMHGSVEKVGAVLNGSVVYGIPAQMDSGEAQATIDACSTIYNYFYLTGRYQYLRNYCGSSTQNYLVYSVANYLETYPYDFATVFYKGHSTYLPPHSAYNPCSHNHTFLYDNDGSSTSIIGNGGFENGNAYWTVGGPGDHMVTSEDHNWGSYSMLLGFKYHDNVVDGRDYAYQLITVPSGLTTVKLSFWYHLFTEDSVSYDWFAVYVAPVGGDPVLKFKKGGLNYPGLEVYGWEQVVIDISAYVGQSIYIYFEVANMYDTAYKTWCYVDDVSATDNWILDSEIGLRTVNGRHDFVFLWSCSTANEAQIGGISGTHTWGMAASWLKRTSLSLDGYANPDYSGHCFIGWQYYSMPFTNSTGYGIYTYRDFVKRFYYYATSGYTIKAALYQASLDCIGKDFASSKIYQGWWQYFPEQNLWLFNKIRIWGDGNMKLP